MTSDNLHYLGFGLVSRPRSHGLGGNDEQTPESVLQRVAVCCSVLQRVAGVLAIAVLGMAIMMVFLCCSVLQCVAVCCSVLQ